MGEREDFLRDFGAIVEKLEKEILGQPPKCSHCYDTGYTDWYIEAYGVSPKQPCAKCEVNSDGTY